MKRPDWVLARCGMAVLSISMTFWTFDSEKLIAKGGVKGAAEMG